MKKALLHLLATTIITTGFGQNTYQQAAESCLQKGFLESHQCMTGESIPSFTAQTYAGEVISSEDLKGKVTVLHFWMMTCPSCMDQLEGLNQLVARYEHTGDVVFLSFTTETIQFLEDDFFPNFSLHFKIVPDYRQYLAGDFINYWGHPMTMVVDVNGNIHEIFSTRIWEGEDWPAEILDRLGNSIEACLKKR